MKKYMNKKVLTIMVIFLVFIILLFPTSIYLKDGGTVKYHAILYEITQWHAICNDIDTPSDVHVYYEGIEIKLLGITIYNNAKEVEYKYCDEMYKSYEVCL